MCCPSLLSDRHLKCEGEPLPTPVGHCGKQIRKCSEVLHRPQAHNAKADHSVVSNSTMNQQQTKKKKGSIDFSIIFHWLGIKMAEKIKLLNLLHI